MSGDTEDFAKVAARAFEDQLRVEIRDWLPAMDAEVLGEWAALIAANDARLATRGPASRVR